ncbi:MAG: GTPase Era [Spirochaetota bacterium]
MNEPVSKGDADDGTTAPTEGASRTKSAFVAVVGRPSTGKSTLLNALCGHKVAIISPVPQTTRNRIRGIVTREEGQLVFVDTPGFHESSRTFNRHMRGLIEETIRDSEMLLYLVDASREPGEEELALMQIVATHDSIPRMVAINKIDAVSPKQLQRIGILVDQRLGGIPTLGISALKGRGTDALLDELFRIAPEGEPPYPPDFYTDQPPEFRVAEIVREKAMEGLRQELPHSIYVDILDMEVREYKETEEQLWIRAAILVERDSQQGMIVGKGGQGIKRIRQGAQREIGKLFPYRIHLDLRVKVDPNWRKNDRVLERLVT